MLFDFIYSIFKFELKYKMDQQLSGDKGAASNSPTNMLRARIDELLAESTNDDIFGDK